MSHDWRGMLSEWSEALIADARMDGQEPPPEVAATGWLGFPGASEAEIAAAEARLDATLPPSYREFLTTTNGWRQTGPFIDRLWSTHEVVWLSGA